MPASLGPLRSSVRDGASLGCGEMVKLFCSKLNLVELMNTYVLFVFFRVDCDCQR